MIRDVTDLAVYNLALENLKSLYRMANLLPPQHRRLRYQVSEAAEKIAPQIAEGFGKKKSSREFCRFLAMALGSSDEVISHIREVKIVASSYTRLPQQDCDILIEKYRTLSKMLNRLHASWQRFN